MSSPFLETIYCDDVRSETGHKLSYMGVYGSNLLIGEFPAVLARIFAVMLLHLPEETAASTVTFLLMRDAEEIGRFTSRVDDIRTSSNPPREVDGKRYLTARFIAQVSPLQLEGPCRLMARAAIDDQLVSGGTLVVERIPVGYIA